MLDPFIIHGSSLSKEAIYCSPESSFIYYFLKPKSLVCYYDLGILLMNVFIMSLEVSTIISLQVVGF